MPDYTVQFEVFEGPLDLLLYLVKKEEVDIYEVNLTKIATQFIEYVEMMRQLDLEVAGEFLVMAATLMYIKSRELLPVDQQARTDEAEEDDPRWELIRQLVEYRKFKDAAAQLQTLELEQERVYRRQPAPPDLRLSRSAAKQDASLFDLLTAVSQVLKRFAERESPRDIVEDRWTVSEKIEQLRKLVSTQAGLRFADLFANTTSRSEVVVTFLALLELMKLRLVRAVQDQPFGPIEIHSMEEDLAPPPMPSEPIRAETTAAAPHSESTQPVTASTQAEPS